MCHPFDEGTRKLMIETLAELDITHHTTGTVVTIEGPRFSTRAESHMFRSWLVFCDAARRILGL